MASGKELVWDQVGERFYETGVDHGVLFPTTEDGTYGNGVAWNGLSNVTESPSGAEPKAVYADNIKYLNLMSTEDYASTIEAYTYPDEFKPCIGEVELTKGVSVGQQEHKAFGYSYRSLIGNDTKGTAAGYYIHLVYGCLAAPSEQSHATINDSPEATAMSFSVSSTPVSVAGLKPTSHIRIDSRTTDKDKLAAFEKILYGGEADPRLPLPDEVKTLLTAAAA